MEYVDKFPKECWECGAKLALRNQVKKFRQPSARRSLTIAMVLTAVLIPLVFGLGIGFLVAFDIRLRGLTGVGYLLVLSMLATSPGGAIAGRALSLPVVVRFRCPKCKIEGDFVHQRRSGELPSAPLHGR